MREYTVDDLEKAAFIAAWVTNKTGLNTLLTAEEILMKCRDRQQLDRVYAKITEVKSW